MTRGFMKVSENLLMDFMGFMDPGVLAREFGGSMNKA
jgi:hypothetical protein